MKKLYIVNNGASYSDNCTFLVEADPDEWDDLEHVLLLCGDADDEDADDGGAAIEAVATEWSAIRTCNPCVVVPLDEFFGWEDKPTPYVVPYDNGTEQATHYYHVNNRGVTARDAATLLRGCEERLKLEPSFYGAEWVDLLRLAIERGEFPEKKA